MGRLKEPWPSLEADDRLTVFQMVTTSGVGIQWYWVSEGTRRNPGILVHRGDLAGSHTLSQDWVDGKAKSSFQDEAG